jgi:imidazolonepropionase-like amidohydrolase
MPALRRIAVALLLACAAASAPAQSAPANESGTFILHKMANANGKETYNLTPSADGGLTLSSDFLFTDRGTKVPLTTKFVAASDLRPISFVATGRVSRQSALDLDITIPAGSSTANITLDGKKSTAPLPANFFTIAGYAPVSMQEMLLRYWLDHGQPASLAVMPTGTVQIHAAGELDVTLNGKPETLTGYTVGGLIWGEESLWLNSAQQLVALVSTDAEFDHFEAVREAYESNLNVFIAHAVTAELAALDRISASGKEPTTKALAIVGGTLIDGNGGPPIPDAVVLTRGDSIVAAGPRSKVQIPADAAVLDATGKTVLPGLWDMHAHYEQVEWGPIYLAAGVTDVRDVGNEFDFITTVRDAVNSGRGLGPHIYMAGIVDGPGPMSIGAITAATPEEARAVVDRYHAAGALQMKIYSSVPPALVPIICDEAHRLGMTVTGHIPNGMDAIQGVEDGMDQINHATYPAHLFLTKPAPPPEIPVFDFTSVHAKADIADFVAHHTVFDPTLALFELISAPPDRPIASFEPGITHVAPQLRAALDQSGVTAAGAARAQANFDALLMTVRLLHQAGLRIVAGTDQAIPGYSLHREIELYVKAGFTPMEAIQSATIVPARVLGLDKTAGSIAPGKRADILIINGDPLADIHNTRNVWKTIAAGAVYDPAPLWTSVGFTP